MEAIVERMRDRDPISEGCTLLERIITAVLVSRSRRTEVPV